MIKNLIKAFRGLAPRLKPAYKRGRIKFRSMLYCFGRSNKSYYDKSIRHPAIGWDHFSFPVFFCYWLQFGIEVYGLTIIYFFQYQFKDFLINTAIELFFIGTTPIGFMIRELFLPIHVFLLYPLDPIYFKYINNNLKGLSDGYLISGFQYAFFYKFFSNFSYFFYLNFYGFTFDFGKLLERTIEHYARRITDEEYYHYHWKKEKKVFFWHKYSIFYKEYPIASKLPYYLKFKNFFNFTKFKHFKNISGWV